jgi:hypothetical protein
MSYLFVFMRMPHGSTNSPYLLADLFANSWTVQRVEYEGAYFHYRVKYTGQEVDKSAARNELRHFYQEAKYERIIIEYAVVDELSEIYGSTHRNNNSNKNNKNIEHIRIPNSSEDAITMNAIEEGNRMVNFHGEKNMGRYYKKSTFNSLKRTNPYTRRKILPANRTNYIATFKGGKRRSKRRRATRRSE